MIFTNPTAIINLSKIKHFSAKILPIFLIVTLAAILRFNKLGVIPPSLNWDEVAHGYNAYSILKTAKDEYSYKLPLYFRSFDDYKPPLYTYLVVPAIGAFGLGEFAIRFPSALLGTFAVITTFLVTQELFKNKKISYLSAFFLSISPWHLQFSRVAFETNTTVFWTTLGLWAFLKGMSAKKQKISLFLSLSALSFSANLYTYHNARLFIPLFSLVLFVLYYKKLLSIKKHLIIPAIISIITIASLLPILTSTAGKMRYTGTNIFADKSPVKLSSQLISQDKDTNILVIGNLVHNRRLAYIPLIIDNYFSHLNPKYLFFTADMERHHAPLIGLLYIWDLPFILAGFYFLFAKNKKNVSALTLIAWFLLAPVASALTWGVPHSLRSEIYLPTYQIIIAIGLYYFLKTRKYKNQIGLFFIASLALNIFFYLHQYYIHLSPEYSRFWLYGRKDAAFYSNSIKQEYDSVIVSAKIEQAYMFWLFALKYDPNKYQLEGGTVSGGFLEDRNKFDKFLFKPIDYESQRNKGKILFVGVPSDFPKDINPLKVIKYLNNEPAIYIVGN